MSRFSAGFQAFIDELKRRHVFRVATAYAVGAFVVLEASNLVFEGLEVPFWVYRALTVLTLVGFPIVLVLSWFFEWTSRGIRREAPMAMPVAAEEVAVRSDSPQTVRAFAFVGLGIVIALVGMGLSVPYMYAQRDAATGSADGVAGADGMVPVSNADVATRLAVLPFVSLTGDDATGFADGLAEDITAALAQVGAVDVVSRTTSEAYRDSDKTARTIGAELGVGLILEGTVRRADDRVRVTVQLIDARTDRHLWANTYDRTLTGDVFRTQSSLAAEIVTAIQAVAVPEQADQAESTLLALRWVEQGNSQLERSDPHWDQAAENSFSEALVQDPELPQAHAGLAQSMLSRAPESPVVVDSAATHAARAILLNPELPEGWAAQAQVWLMRGESDSATAYLRRAIELQRTATQAFTFDWQERVRAMSPQVLEQVERTFEAFRSGDTTVVRMPAGVRVRPMQAPPAGGGVRQTPQTPQVNAPAPTLP